MNIRYTAKVTNVIDPKTKHYSGLPPELTGGIDTRKLMDVAAVLVIEHLSSGIFLFRFSKDGRCVGDTWHQSEEYAKEQAAYEFKGMLTEWKSVPNDVEDVFLFGLNAEYRAR